MTATTEHTTASDIRDITFYYKEIHMPISIDEFDDEPDAVLDLEPESNPARIVRFLADHDDHAFTQTEIHEQTDIPRGSVGTTLSRLEARGLVRHRGRYWAIADDDRLASYAAQQGASSVSATDDYYGEE